MAAAVLELTLNEDSIDTIFIECKWFGCGHAVWSVPGLKIIVWYQGKKVCPPSGWTLHSLLVWHSDVGGVSILGNGCVPY
jgi:hypothetical protein